MLGLRFLNALLEKGDVSFMLHGGVTEDFFYKNELPAFVYIKDHALKYGKFPELDTLDYELGSEHGSLMSSPEPFSYYLDGIHNRYKCNQLSKMSTNVKKQLEEDPDNAKAVLDFALGEVFPLMIKKKKNILVNFEADAYDIGTSAYLEAQQPLELQNKIQLGWPSLDKKYDGGQPGDLISLVARTGLGKTLMLQYSANHARKYKKVSAIFSYEIKPKPLIQRQIAIDAKINLTNFKKGKMSTPIYNKLKKRLKGLHNSKDRLLWIIDANGMTVDDIKLYCMYLNVDIAYVDGAYLVKSKNARLNRMDRVTETAERLKDDIASELEIPVVATWQFNRQVPKLKATEVGVEHIGLSDSIGQLSSIAVGLFQDENVETEIKRKVTIIKGRDGQSGSFWINWNFHHTDFSEYDDSKEYSKVMHLTGNIKK